MASDEPEDYSKLSLDAKLNHKVCLYVVLVCRAFGLNWSSDSCLQYHTFLLFLEGRT